MGSALFSGTFCSAHCSWLPAERSFSMHRREHNCTEVHPHTHIQTHKQIACSWCFGAALLCALNNIEAQVLKIGRELRSVSDGSDFCLEQSMLQMSTNIENLKTKKKRYRPLLRRREDALGTTQWNCVEGAEKKWAMSNDCLTMNTLTTPHSRSSLSVLLLSIIISQGLQSTREPFLSKGCLKL